MKRIGKDGKPIYVYKLRTMHPYAEYLQELYMKNLIFRKEVNLKMILGLHIGEIF